jgi:hypothetical protein
LAVLKALAICVVYILGQRTTDHQNPKPYEVEQTVVQNQNLVKPSAKPVNDADTPRQGNIETRNEQAESAPTWKDPEWLVVYVTVAYTLISGFTLVVIYRQNRSIQNTERAVLIPTWDNLIHLNPEAPNGTVSHCFQWNFQNCGKTPGFIRELQGNLILLNSLNDLSRKPRYDKRIAFQGDPVIPGKSLEIGFYSPMKDARPYQTIEDDFRKNAKILFAYGFVRYQDIFGRTHETRFGLRYQARESFDPTMDHFTVDGPKAYNRYT